MRTVRPLTLLVWLSALGMAQQSLENEYRTTGKAVVAAFEKPQHALQSSSAVFQSGRSKLAYGVVVSSSGEILTKASEIEGIDQLAVVVDRKTYRHAKILAIDPKWDVALVRIAATDLMPVEFGLSSELPKGTWVAANGVTSRTQRRLLPGIISAETREILPAGGLALGVALDPNKESLEITGVDERSGAKEADLQQGDVIQAVDDQKVSSPKELAEALNQRQAGSSVILTILRGGKQEKIQVVLRARDELSNPERNRNDEMSGDVSSRRSGFPRVLQHDIMGNSKTQGGPLLDLDGRCIGMNIARANRAESYAIPVEDLKIILTHLRRLAQSDE